MDVLVEGMSYERRAIKTILLIEDESAAALRLGEMFAPKADYQVIVTSDCLTALKFIRSCTPDLMLMDERLLMHNGIDLRPRLLIMKDLQDIPFLLFCADFPERSVGRRKEKGVAL